MTSPLALRHPKDWRQLLTVVLYLSLVLGMYWVPAMRQWPVLVAACAYSFLSAVVNHNTMHLGLFASKRMNNAFRMVLSFCALYPVSANIPSHNLVHHHFDDDGQPDWAAPEHVSFRWNLLNLLHFPNVAGPITFEGVNRWGTLRGKAEFRRQYTMESIFAFGLTGLLLLNDFWSALFYVMVPQLFGARWFLRINIIQHEGIDTRSDWNHSRNFVGRVFNWFMLNNGYHTIHHNRAGLHWSVWAEEHAKEVKPRIDPSLDEPSFLGYLARTYLWTFARPAKKDFAAAERGLPSGLKSREEQRAEAEALGAAL